MWVKEINSHKKFIVLSLVFLIIALVLNYAAGSYASKKATESVSDLILDNIPAVNLTPLFVYGPILIIGILFAYPLFFRVKDLSKTIIQFSFLVLVRSFFITLTHLKIPANAVTLDLPNSFRWITFQNDLFFSGHTAFAFLGFLIYKNHDKKLAIFFLLSTIVMAITVLLMHVHYSIDVFAALFITYGCYHIIERLSHQKIMKK